MHEPSSHKWDWKKLREKIIGLGETSVRKSYYPELQQRLRELQESETRFRTIFDAANDAIFVYDVETATILDANRKLTEMYGYTPEEARGLTIEDLSEGKPPYTQADAVRWVTKASGGTPQLFEWRAKDKSGRVFWVEVNLKQAVIGGRNSVLAVIRDITLRKQDEETLHKLNRTLKMLSQVNEALVRATDESALLREVCNVAVDIGGYRMAWIGYAERDPQKTISPVAYAGYEAGYLGVTRFSWEDNELGRGPIGTAIRTGKPATAGDIATDPNFALWREAALKRGYATSIAVPLISNGQAFGALVLYAGQASAFDKGEIDLLTDLAGDLAYGVMSLRIREARKQAEDALRDAETKFRTLVEESLVGVYMIAPDSTFAYVNPCMASIFGYTPEELIPGKPLLDLVAPESRDLVAKNISERLSGGVQSLHYSFKGLRKDGSIIDVDVLGTVTIYQGRPTIIGTAVDMTERMRAEEALRRSEERYRELVQDANSIIIRWSSDGTIRFFNEFAQTFFGYSKEEVLGKSVIGTIVPRTDTAGHDLTVLMDDILKHPERHGTSINENIRKNGERVWIAWTNKPIFDEQGHLVELLSVGLDITARRKAEEALLESEERYRSIFNSNADAFLLFDLNGTIVDANAKACNLFGYPCSEFIGLSGRDIVVPECYHLFEQFLSTRLGEWFKTEAADVRKDGSRFDIESHGTRLRYAGKERLLAIVFDVTERNRARESMQLFTDVVHNMQAGLYVYHLEDRNDDRTLRLVDANPASTTSLGLNPDEVIGRYMDQVFPRLREYDIPRRFADVVRTGKPFTMENFAYSDARLEPRHYSYRVFPLPGDRVGILFEDITELIRVQEEKKLFYRKTIEAATEGKLIICDRSDMEKLAGPAIVSCEIKSGEDLGKIRQIVDETARSAGMDESRAYDLVLCVGEATTNTIKHAGGGTVSVHRKGDSLLVLVTDCGHGIQAINLPEVALKRGYTTAISLGMGYKAMISIADKVYLATGTEGTTVGIEMKIAAPEQPSLIAGLPDTWK